MALETPRAAGTGRSRHAVANRSRHAADTLVDECPSHAPRAAVLLAWAATRGGIGDEYLSNYTCNAGDGDDGDYDDGDEDGDELFSLAAGKRALHNRNVHRNVQPYPQRRLRVLP